MEDKLSRADRFLVKVMLVGGCVVVALTAAIIFYSSMLRAKEAKYLASLTPAQRTAMLAKQKADQAERKKADEASRKINDPGDYITAYADQAESLYNTKSILSFDGNVTNGSAVWIKDPELQCDLAGPSGTVIARPSATVYAVIDPGEKYEFKSLAMGYADPQWVSSSCSVTNFKVISKEEANRTNMTATDTTTP